MRFLLRIVGVPLYRLFFFVKRQSSKALMPAKRRVLYLVSNKHAVHAIVLIIVTAVGIANLGGNEVRAESYGKDSMLYALVSGENAGVVEVVAAESVASRKPGTYMNDASLDPQAHLDLNYRGEAYVTTSVGSTLAQSGGAGSEEKPEVPKRDKVLTYKVENGDVLGSISEKFGLSLSSILWANDLSFRSVIRPGDELVIPPTDGVLHTVKDGETVGKIASRYGADADEIVAFNKLANADDLREGEQLMVPNGEPPAPAPVVRTTAPVVALFTAPSASATAADYSGDKQRGAATGNGTWVWPTDWRVITQYYGWSHTGVDIDGDYSTVSYAAADGVVIYSGWRNGYGMTVEIDHGNGLVTRYAHHSKLYVNVGDHVVAGQTLAQTGTTGHSTGTHLHFEVIKNGAFQNPLNYIR